MVSNPESGSLSSIKNHYRFLSSEHFLIPTAHRRSGRKSPVFQAHEVKGALGCMLPHDALTTEDSLSHVTPSLDHKVPNQPAFTVQQQQQRRTFYFGRSQTEHGPIVTP